LNSRSKAAVQTERHTAAALRTDLDGNEPAMQLKRSNASAAGIELEGARGCCAGVTA